MKKFFVPLIILGLVILIAGGIFLYFQAHPKSNTAPTKKVSLIVSQTDDQFSLKATKQDSLGVDPQTTFTLTSKDPVAADVVQANLTVTPSFSYKLESSDNNTFTLIPKEQLQAKTVYSFAIATAKTDGGLQREYTWAYQIRDEFKVTSTVPRDKATSVPFNSGIEITFSTENFVNYEKYVDISPKVKGKFEQYRKTVIFAPDELQYGTVYTVTVKKGMPLKDSTDTLADDYIFRFETESTSRAEGYLNFGNSFFEYPVKDVPVMTVNEYNSGLSKLPVTVWRFGNFSQFADAVKMQTVSLPYWAYYARENNPYATDSLQKIMTFESELKSAQYSSRYFDFPESIPAGYYLVEISWNNKRLQAFLQVTNLTAVFQGSATQSFIWLHDAATKEAVGGATIAFSGDDTFKDKTDGDGLSVFTTPEQMRVIGTDENNYQTYFFTATTSDQNILIPAQRDYGGSWSYDMSGPIASQNDYWAHLYTNRNLYQPTDSLKFWGVVKPRVGKALSTVTAELTASNYYSPVFDRNKQLIASKTLTVSDFGTFIGAIDYSGVVPGSYRLTIYSGDTVIASAYVEVQTYTKPAYSIEVTTSKKAVFAGDSVTFAVTAAFFDGTPVGKLGLNYTGSLGGGSVTTDENGKAEVVLGTSYSEQSGYYYPSYQYFSVSPSSAEVTNIYSDAYVYVFGPHYQIDLEAKKDGTISGTVSDIDLDAMNAQGKDFIWDYRGKPLPGIKTHLTIYEQSYAKIESGSYYDYINKKTIKTYNYELRENVLKEADVVTDQSGVFSYTYPFGGQKNYRIVAASRDADNRPAQQSAYLHLREIGYDYGFGDNYYLTAPQSTAGTETKTYNPGEAVDLTFNKNEDVLPETEKATFVYFKDYNGIFDVAVSKKPTLGFKFRDAYAPNIFVSGIYFDGRSYHVTQSKSLLFDKNAKKLNIQVTPDKDAYAPGDTARVDVVVTNPDDKPVTAEVNLSIIDEALAAIQWNDQSTVLDSLYRYIQPSVAFSYVTDKEVAAPAAERGGCFTGETQILMADGSQKDIKDVRIGEQVLTRSSEKDAQLISATVLGTAKHLVNEYLIINGSLSVTPVHIIYLNDRWQEASQAKVGDYLRDSNGARVMIKSIVVRHTPVEVYNLHTSAYTFMAENVYVHNEKAGGRQNFQDVAYFNSVVTDKNGRARVEFTLPDNITSWRTTVQAVTKDLEANGTQTALITTKPFFVDVSASDQYLTSDKPIIRLRGFGKGIGESDTIAYEVSYPDLNKTDKYNGKAFQGVDVSLPQFTEGVHSIVVKGTVSNGLSDTLTRRITFSYTNVTEAKVLYYLLDENTKIEGGTTGLTEATFMNKERGQYYNALQHLKWYGGDRIDQKMARTYGQTLLNQYFNETEEVQTLAFTDYQLPEGGISLLPYSSAELLLTAKALELAGDQFDVVAAKNYFYSILDAKNSTTEEIVNALFGLANIGEPVLTDITNFLTNQNPAPELKLYLARGLANMGAGEYAKTVLTDILTSYGETVDPYIRLKLGQDQDEITEYTYQAAVLASLVSMPEAEKLFNYAMANPATHQLNTLEELAYLSKTLPLLSGTPVSFDYQLDNQTKTVSLKNDETLSLALTTDQLQHIAFSNISGQVGLIASYRRPIDIAQERQDSNLKINRTYSVGNKSTTTFNENDIVKITLEPVISTKAIDTEYQITDYLPSGLKILTETYTRNIPYDQRQRYPYEINGQAVKFWSGKPSSSFFYYAIVVGKGDYTADPAILQGFVAKESKAYGQSTGISIK